MLSRALQRQGSDQSSVREMNSSIGLVLNCYFFCDSSVASCLHLVEQCWTMPKWWNESGQFTLQNCPGSAWTFVLSNTSCTLQVLTEAVAEAIAQKARETEEDAAVDSKDPQKCGRMWQTTAGSDSLEIKPSPSWCQNLWMRQPEKARMLLFKAHLHGVTVSYLRLPMFISVSLCFRRNRWILQDRSVSISKRLNKN